MEKNQRADVRIPELNNRLSVYTDFHLRFRNKQLLLGETFGISRAATSSYTVFDFAISISINGGKVNIFRDNYVNCSNQICIDSQKLHNSFTSRAGTLSNMKDSKREIKISCRMQNQIYVSPSV